MRSSRSRAYRPGEKYLPVAYLGLAVACVVALLPTTLRPPTPPPPSSAEFDPNEPPDDNPEAIIAELARGTSATAGGGVEVAGPGTGDGVTAAAGTVPPRACPRGFGNPPRQTESVYAPPCAPAWHSDNGGSTARGVTATEIRIAYTGGVYVSIGEGAIPREPEPGENALLRTFRVFQEYFNATFQLYGRYLQLYASTPESGSEAGQRAAVVKADEEYQVFGTGMSSAAGCDESARRGLLAFCNFLPTSMFEQSSPYLWSWSADGTQLMQWTAELVCKQLIGRQAEFAGSPDLQTSQRRFGVVYYNRFGSERDGYTGYQGPNADALARELQGCGQDPSVLGFSDAAGGELAVVLARLRADGVTTVIPLMSYVDLVVFTNAASSNGYVPEWIVNGIGFMDHNRAAYLPNQTQWAHAFGITPMEPARPRLYTDCYRAYREIDPDNLPDEAFCHLLFGNLFMLVTGLQLAGPNLTPEAYRQGLFGLSFRYPERPVWAMGGGYGPGHYTYPDDVALVWWDTTATDPFSGLARGAYRYLDGGRRYRLGDIPAEEPRFFGDGVTETADSGDYG